MAIQMKPVKQRYHAEGTAIEQYFHMVLSIMLYRVVLNLYEALTRVCSHSNRRFR